jgi:Tfp pilus assembly protein PilF
MLGDRGSALKYLDRALALDQSDKETLFGAAIIYNHLGETGTSLEWLRKALQAGYSLTTVQASPDFDNLHNNSNFQSLLRQNAQ